MTNLLDTSGALKPSDHRSLRCSRKMESALGFSSAGLLMGLAIVVLLASSVGHAQDALSKTMCNKNNTNNTIAYLMSQTGACSPSNNAASAAAKAANLQLKQQAAGNAIQAGFQIWSLFHPPKNVDQADVPPIENPEEVERMAEAQRQAEAAQLLNTSNEVFGDSNSNSESAGSPNTASTLDSLLDNGQPSSASTSAINSLLGGSTQQSTGDATATNAVNNLLGDNDTPPPAVNVPQDPNAPKPGDPFYQPPAPDKSQWYTPPAPLQDQDMNADLQDSTDQPNPSMFDALKQDVQSGVQTAKQAVRDELNTLVGDGKHLVTQGQELIAPLVNDPGFQAASHFISGGGSTMPLTAPADSPSTLDRNVTGQATVGGLDLVKGPTAIGSYGSKMVNQGGATVGWAQTNIQGNGEESQP
jgi:hypothetical protein